MGLAITTDFPGFLHHFQENADINTLRQTVTACLHMLSNSTSTNKTYTDQNLKKKSVVLLVVLYGCEIWSFTLREEHRLRVFENGARGRYLDLKGRKTDHGKNCIMMNFIACILHVRLLG
jgi:hypothetical protein